MEDFFGYLCLTLALVGVPAAFLAFCVLLFVRRVSWPTYLAYFVLFGTVGGWALAFALSPSGLTAACIVFLMTFVPLGCLLTALLLQFRPRRGLLEPLAMIGGYLYAGLFAAAWTVGLLFAASR